MAIYTKYIPARFTTNGAGLGGLSPLITIGVMGGGVVVSGAAVPPGPITGSYVYAFTGCNTALNYYYEIDSVTLPTSIRFAFGSIQHDILGAMIAHTIMDNDGTTDITMEGAMKLLLSINTAKDSGGGTGTLTFRDIADTKDRLICSVDGNGNRTNIITLDAT